MENTANYSFRETFIKSVIYGFLLGSFFVMMNALDFIAGFCEKNQIVNNFKYLFRILGLLACVIIFRKKGGGYISFEMAFVFSLFTFVFAMLACDTVICITYNIYPELLYAKIETMRETLLGAGVSKRLIEISANSALWLKNPYYVIFSFLTWALFVGPLISFIFALMMQKIVNRE
jgi:hypothetical protein